MAVCCADRTVIEQLIMLKGKNLMINWHGNNVMPVTYYATSDNGWMTTDIFHGWMESFV